MGYYLKSKTETTDSKKSSSTPETLTITTESGAFIRKTWRHGKKRRQETTRVKPNYKKVVLGHIGEFEVYVYPFDYPDKVFIGKFPVSTYINIGEVKSLFGLTSTMKWYLNGEAFNEPQRSKAANARRRTILSAYNLALSELRNSKKPYSTPNYNYTTEEEKKA